MTDWSHCTIRNGTALTLNTGIPVPPDIGADTKIRCFVPKETKIPRHKWPTYGNNGHIPEVVLRSYVWSTRKEGHMPTIYDL